MKTQFSAGPPQGKLASDIWWCNISGGTDFAGAFIGGNRELPQVPGEMQCRLLGCAVEAWNEQGEPVIGEVGELVCSQPIPSMPLYFWGDAGHQRYLSSYFDMYPGVWRHGDWLKVGPNGGCVIYGRSDATINRYGLRMGTSELYSAVEALPEVLDSMVVDLEYLGRESYMPLFVVLRDGLTLEAALHGRQATSGLHENLEAGVEQQRPNLEQCLVNCNATVIFETERIAFFVQEQKAVLAPRFRAQASVEHSIVKIT
jgi:acyl-coenzyme A synthetase/AMP-(fatty) acid ligase